MKMQIIALKIKLSAIAFIIVLYKCSRGKVVMSCYWERNMYAAGDVKLGLENSARQR